MTASSLSAANTPPAGRISYSFEPILKAAAVAILVPDAARASERFMRISSICAVCAWLLLVAACSGNNKSTSSGTTTRAASIATSLATAPPPQASPPNATVAAGTPETASSPQPGGVAPTVAPVPTVNALPPTPLDVQSLTDQIRLKPADLATGYGVGQFQAFQPNEAAISGYDDPQGVLARMVATGRLGGFLQQILTPDSSGGAGVTIEVWRDAAGAQAFFDNYPRPSKDVSYKEVTLPEQLGDQMFAIEANAGGQTALSISWRRGRLILGIGEVFPAGKQSYDKLKPLIDLLDKKAQAAK